MKRLTMMALAAATAISPLAMAPTASAQNWRHNDRYDRDRDHDRDHDGRHGHEHD
jgi:Ni/Co efflux regulator RcnB